MRKIFYSLILASLILTSCSSVKKGVAYKGMYDEKPVSVLLMPPINKTTNVEAKEFFHSTLMAPLASKGYYIIPPFMSMDILKKESAYDSEMFLDGGLSKFQEVFGADTALFTIIHTWKKGVLATVTVEVEYILKSTKTNEVLFNRRGTITYDTSVSTGLPGIGGLISTVALSAANTVGTKYVDVANVCNAYTFQDIPVGKYAPENATEKDEKAAPKVFRASLKSGLSDRL